jgi:hypothetical protein
MAMVSFKRIAVSFPEQRHDAAAASPVPRLQRVAARRQVEQHQRLRCLHCGKGRFVLGAPIAPAPLPLLHLRGPP